MQNKYYRSILDCQYRHDFFLNKAVFAYRLDPLVFEANNFYKYLISSFNLSTYALLLHSSNLETETLGQLFLADDSTRLLS